MLKHLIPVALATLSVAHLAQAQEGTPGVDARQQNRMERIHQGVVARADRDVRRERHDAEHRPGPRGGGIDEREVRQREAIRRGIESGELTPREAERLRREQGRIERHEQMAKADGSFTPRERMRIQHELDQAQRHIRHETHDRQRVGGHDRHQAGGHDRPHASGYDRPHASGHDRGNHAGWERGHGQRVAHRSGGSPHRR